MKGHIVLLTDCLSEPGPEIARRLADAGATVLLNSREDIPELGDLLQDIAEAGGRAVACNLDPSDRERFETVIEFVESMAGSLTGVVLQSGVQSTPSPLQDAESEPIRDSVAETVEGAVDWCRLALPALTGSQDAALVGLWSSPSSWSISAAASFAAWEQVLDFARTEAVPGGVDVHVVKTGRPGSSASARNRGLKDQKSAADEVLSHLGILHGTYEVDRPLMPAEGVAK